MKSEITYAELCQIIAEIGEYSYTADIENINLIEAGFESLKVMLISSELKRRGINVRVSELLKKPYLAEWWKIIKMQSVSAESKKEVDRSRTETMEFPPLRRGKTCNTCTHRSGQSFWRAEPRLFRINHIIPAS